MSAIYPVDVAEIDATITSLASRYPTLCNAAACVATTAEGRTVRYLRIRGGPKPAADRVKVLLVGGVHAREYAPPAVLLRLVARLCTAYSGTVGPIVTGTVTFPEEKVSKVMEGLDLYVLPLANPDGRAFNRASDVMWRKNRRVFPGPNRIGVDVNRNFPVGRDFRTFYDIADPGVRTAVVIEDDWVTPEHDPYEVFRGDVAAEEPETRNVMDLIDTLKPNVFVDVHSYGPDVLYPWSLETNQTSDPDKNFANAAWDGRRDATSGGGSAYEEFIPSKVVKLHQEAGKAMVTAMNAAAPSPRYTCSNAAVGLYIAPATSQDYAFSKNFGAGKWNILSFTIEVGTSGLGAFRPDEAEYQTIEKGANAGLLALLYEAADACAIATAVYGDRDHPDVRFLREVRDVRLRRTRLGRLVRRPLVAGYARAGPPAAARLQRHPNAADAVRAGVIAPLVRVLRALLGDR